MQRQHRFAGSGGRRQPLNDRRARAVFAVAQRAARLHAVAGGEAIEQMVRQGLRSRAQRPLRGRAQVLHLFERQQRAGDAIDAPRQGSVALRAPSESLLQPVEHAP